MTIQDIVIGQKHYRITGTGYAPEGEILLADTAVDATQDPALEMFLTMGQQANDTFLTNEDGTWGNTW